MTSSTTTSERVRAVGHIVNDHAPDVRHDTSIQHFLDRLGRAVTTSGDGAAAAALWDTPAFVMSDDRTRAIATEAELAALVGGGKGKYNRRGIVDTRAEIVRLTWPTERIAIVEVRWPYLDAEGDELGDETATYTLRRDGRGELKLVVAVLHGEGRGGQRGPHA